MTQPSFVASSAVDANTPGNGASIVITTPVAWLSGHVGVLQAYKESSAPITPPSGWVEVAGSPFAQGTNFWMHLFYKVLGGSEPGSYTFPWTGSTWREGGAYALVDCDQTTPINVLANATNASSTTITCPAVTPTVNNTLIATFATLFNDETWSAIGQSQTRRLPTGVRSFGSGTVAGPASGVSSGAFTHTVLAAAVGLGVTIAFQEVQSSPPKSLPPIPRELRIFRRRVVV